MADLPVPDGAGAIRDHLSAAVRRGERGRHGARFVLCDEQGRVRVHCPVDDLPPDPGAAQCLRVVSVFANAVAESDPRGALLVALTRPGSAMVTDPDRRWFHAAHQACRQMGVRLLGVYLLTPVDEREILLDDAL